MVEWQVKGAQQDVSDVVFPFSSRTKRPNALPFSMIIMVMDKKEFDVKVRELARWDHREERWRSLVQEQTCGDCQQMTKGRRVNCQLHRIGTRFQHVKHQCSLCKIYIYDGSLAEPRRNLEMIKQDPNRKNKSVRKGKQIQTPAGVFDSCQAAALHFKIPATAISYRLRTQTDTWYEIK